MTEDSKISLKKFIKKIILKNSKREIYGMNIVLSMIWLPILLSLMEVSCGLARIMMVTFKVISWPKDMEV